MFGNKASQGKNTPMATPAPAPAPVAHVEERAPKAPKNYISAGTVIEGNIISHEDLRMDGTVKGDIKTTGCLILGKDSNVEGNILAAEAEVAGLITGTVESKGSLTIRATCKIFGDIVTRSLNDSTSANDAPRDSAAQTPTVPPTWNSGEVSSQRSLASRKWRGSNEVE